MATVSLGSAAGKWVMVSAILASSMAFIDATALNVVLPALQKDLQASGTDLFWILNAYLLMLASLILIGGALGDKLGRKKIFMWGIVLFMAGSAACGFSGGVLSLVIFRALQGIGGALMIPGSLSLISASIHEKEKGRAIGTWSAFTTVVTMGGPILGGALADAGLWRYIFFLNLPVGIAAFLMLAFRVRENRDDDGKPIDYAGAASITAALILVTFGFLRIPGLGIQHIQVYGSLGGGAVFIVLFLVIELRSAHPMMPAALFRNATFTGANLLTFFLYAGLGAGMLFLSLNMVQVQGYTQLQSGLTFLPFTLLMIALARFAGSLADRYGPRLLLICGPALAGCGLLYLSFIGQTAGASDYWTSFFPGVIIFGLGMSLTVAPLTAAVMGSASGSLSGTASGVNNAVTRLANVFANAVFGTLAVLFFSASLENNIRQMPLNAAEKKAVTAQAVNLGDARVPAQVKSVDKNSLDAAYKKSFISSYRQIMRISAALGFAAAVMGAVFIRRHRQNTAV